MVRIKRLLCILACAALGASVAAQGKGALGRDNADFARKLFEEGYADLAEGLGRAIESNQGSATELLEVKALGFELQFDRAKRLNDLPARKEGLRAVIAAEQQFLSENARTNVANVVRANLPNVYLELASTLTAMQSRERDAAARGALTQEGQQVFDEAKQGLEKRIKDFKERIDNGTGDPVYNENQLRIALFNLARMDFQHAQLFAEVAPERQQLLESALKRFTDFNFDYSGLLQSYQGMIYQGLIREALGKSEDAIADYQDLIALREEFEVDAKGVYLIGPDEGDLISGATWQLVKLLTRMKRERAAIAAADDYLAHTPDPYLNKSGIDVAVAKAEAQISSGDIGGASTTAQALFDLDPQGIAGRRGRELLGRLPVSNLSPDKILKIAETSAGRGEFGRALDLCRLARELVRGARDEQDMGSASFQLAGTVYRSTGRLNEASLAYDLAFELYPTGKSTPECLYGAVNLYLELHKKDRARFYSERADDRMKKLAERFPNHPRSASAGIYQGQRRENDGDFEGARDFYGKIGKDTSFYHEAQFRLAGATYQQAKNLMVQGKRDEAEPLLKTAEDQYKSAMQLIQAAQETTLDTAIQQRLGNFLISCRLGLANLYLDTKRAKEVQPLLEGLDKKITDPDVVANVWGLRITALQAEGKIDEAVALFESVILTAKDSPGAAAAAGVLARALDESAQALFDKDPRAARAGELWRKAAYYYTLSVKPALAGTAPLRADSVSVVAQRLYIIGLFFNAVPEGQFTFVDWQGTVADPSMWEEARDIYDRLDKQAPSYRVSIERARTLAILGQVAEAEGIYARLFDQVTLFTPGDTTNRFDKTVTDARPELVTAYLEWGVSSQMVGLQSKDKARLDRAGDIYTRAIANSNSDQRLWWQAKFFAARLLFDIGDYAKSKLLLESVQRTTDTEFDKGRFGFRDKFQALANELKKK